MKKLLDLGHNVRESRSSVLSEVPLESASTGRPLVCLRLGYQITLLPFGVSGLTNQLLRARRPQQAHSLAPFTGIVFPRAVPMQLQTLQPHKLYKASPAVLEGS